MAGTARTTGVRRGGQPRRTLFLQAAPGSHSMLRSARVGAARTPYTAAASPACSASTILGTAEAGVEQIATRTAPGIGTT